MLIPRGRRRTRLLLLLLLFATAGLPIILISLELLFNERLGQRVHTVLQAGIFYAIGITRYDFRPTPDELACLSGTAPRINAPDMPATIPIIAHFGWAVDKPAPVPMMLWLAIRAAAYHLGPDVEIRFHFVHEQQAAGPGPDPWWDDIRRRVTLVRHDPDFLADGGIWLETDALLLRPLDALLTGRRDVVMAHEGGHRTGLTNAVILAKPRAPFLQRWYAAYASFDDRQWNYHSVRLPSVLADKNPLEVCQLSPAAFFWPLWTESHIDWMHQPLSPAEAADVAAAMERTGGALFEEQLVYHAWNHAAGKYVKHLTPARILAEDTRFNMLVIRYVDMK